MFQMHASRWPVRGAYRRGLVSVGLIIMVSMFLAGCGVNNIPTYEEQAKASWSNVLNQYQRRADLIPNLIETVKGFAKQEREVLREVVEARGKATSFQIPKDILTNPESFQKFQQLQGSLSSALARLIAVSERYPDLKSSQNFLTLQTQLEGTENRIAIARRDYIEAVKLYNTELKTIPGRWWKMFVYPDAKEMEGFTVEAEKTKTPEVKF